MQKKLLYGAITILLFLYLSTILTDGSSCEFCNYNATFDIIQKFDTECGKPSCDLAEKKEITILKKYLLEGMNADLFKIEISNDNGYDGNENDSLFIAIKSEYANPVRDSFINNYKIGDYTGYFGKGTYVHPDPKASLIYVAQFKLPNESKLQAGKLVTVRWYLTKYESKELFKALSLKSKEAQ